MNRLLPLCCVLLCTTLCHGAPPPGEAKRIKTKEGRRVFVGTLVDGDAKDAVLGTPAKVMPIPMVKGSLYRIEVKSGAFDPVLRITSSAGKEITRFKSAAGSKSIAEVEFMPTQDDEYLFILSTQTTATGGYKVMVLPLGRPGDAGVSVVDDTLDTALVKEHVLKVRPGKQYTVDLLYLGEGKAPRLSAGDGKIKIDAAALKADPRRARLTHDCKAAGTLNIRVAADQSGRYLLRIKEERAPGSLIELIGGHFVIEDELNKDTPKDKVRVASHAKLYPVQMKAGFVYVIRMLEDSTTLDPYLRLENPAGEQVAADDDADVGNSARIEYECKEDGLYTIVATAYASGTGTYTLSVRERKK